MASKAIGFLNFKFGADLKGFERAMNKAQKKLKKFGKNVERTGKSLTTGLTLPIIGLGAVSIKTFATFEQGMLKVKAISGATASEFKALTESAKELGSTTMFTASQVAELQLNLSKLGFDPQSILDSSQAILNLAQATDSDLGEAATVAASTMNAFGLEATDMTMIADVMADSFSSSALDLQKFQTAMASVAPVANQAGADIQRTSAILGVLVNNGIEASSAGTALRNVFIELAIQGKTWDEAMNEINSSVDPLATAFELFGKKGASVATIIANNGTEIQALTADFNDSAGEAQKMADIMDSGVGGAMRKLQSQTEGLFIQLGTALMPVFTKILDKLSSLVTWFSLLSDETKKNIVKWGLILAAIGPVLIIFGKLSLGLGILVGAFKAVGVFLVTNPWLAAAAAIAAVGYAIYDTFIATNKLTSAQDDLDSISKSAQASIMDEKVAVDLLTQEIKAQGLSLEDKKIALDKLKKISPEYYGSLEIAKGKVVGLDIATKNYTASLLQQAKAEAMKQKLVSLNLEMLEIDEKIKSGDYKFLGDMLVLGKKDIQDRIDALIKEYSITKKISDLEKKKTTTTPTTTTPTTTTPTTTPTTTTTTTPTSNLSNDIKKLEEPLSKVEDQFKGLVTWKHDFFKATESPVEDQFKNILFWTQELTAAQEAHNATVVLLEDIMFSAAMSAANSQENFFKSFIENIKKAIKQLLIQLAVMTVINLILGGPTMTIAKAFGGAKASVLGLAEGGLVTGPTTALIGEGVGTTASNPEVVAPLDKLKQYMGGGNQNIIVEGVLKGNDIYLSNRNTSVNRLRTT